MSISMKAGFIGKFVVSKFTDEKQNETRKTVTCIILDVKKNSREEPYYLVLNLAAQTDNVYIKELIETSSVRIGKDVREKLTALYKLYVEKQNLYAEQEKIRSMIWKNENEIKNAKNLLLDCNGYYTHDQVKRMLSEFNLDISSWSIPNNLGDPVNIVVRDSNNGERYDKIGCRYPFISVNYECCAFAEREGAEREYDSYANNNAPRTRPALAKISTNVEKEIEAGDKYIYAFTNYHLTFKKGYVKEDVDRVISVLKG